MFLIFLQHFGGKFGTRNPSSKGHSRAQLYFFGNQTRPHRLSSSSDLFTDEWNNLKSMFLKLKYPPRLIDSTMSSFIRSQDQAKPQQEIQLDKPISNI